MKYKDDYPLFDESEREHIFQSGNTAQICQTLVTITLRGMDRTQVEQYCLDLLEHPDASVRAVAATCIGHLARIHRKLDLDIVLPALYRHQSDPGKYVAGNVDNALDDIEIFMKVSVEHDPAMKPKKGLDDPQDEETPRPLTDEDVEHAFRSNESLQIQKTLVALAFRSPNWQKTEDYCLKFLEHPEAGVRGVAAQCISHLIYNQHHLDIEPARSALLRHQSDASKYVRDQVNNALRAIDLFEKKSLNQPSAQETDNNQPIGPLPKNGQSALDNSVSINQSNTRYRIGIDLEEGEIVVFGMTKEGRYSGDVRTWSQLTSNMKNALIENALITEQGEIILHDERGNITGYGKKVIA